eukprot:s1531_g11.t1
MDTNCFHFTVEAVTSDGPRTAVDVVRAAFRILDYKLSQFMDARHVLTDMSGRICGGGNLYLTCLRLRFEERGSWSKALEPQVDHSVVPEGEGAEGDRSPDGASPAKLQKEKSNHWLTVPPRCEEDSSSSNSSPTPRKFRSKLVPLAFGYAADSVLLQQSTVTASGFWARALGGNDVAAKKSAVDADGGLAMTAKQLRPVRGAATSQCRSARGLAPPRASYYFELEVLQTELETSRTLALGFCWSKGLRMQDPLPQELPGSFLLGGELPRALFGGTEICRPDGWRPVVHVLSGSRVGALLEVRDHGTQGPLLRLSIVQDGTARAEAALWPATLETLTEDEAPQKPLATG